ncbi:MAG TPA: hypothetical protein VMV48_09880 [Gallionellaceae bacterium]|nr:hypothetical protein [Gallionellaceae bacterium]
MSSLETIAEAKIQAALDRRFIALTSAIVAVTQEMNSRGVLPSSMAVQKIHGECIALFDQVRDDIKTEYSIVLNETLWPTDRLISRLIVKAIQHFEKVAERARSEIAKAAHSLLNSGMHKSLNEDVPLAHDRAITDLSLFVDGHRKVKLNRSIKTAVLFVPKLLGRILGLKAHES